MISTLPIGFQIERFQIQSILGKGGFGITYVAVDTRIGLRVAIKELLPDTIATRAEGATVVPQTESMMESWQWARERFLEEAQILAEFSHPAIVGIHCLLEANGTVYMVMDLVDGESYESRLKRIGREPDQESLMNVLGPILDGLQEVHAKNLLHRDIKTENILISSYGQPVLIDFGSARTSIGATMTMTSIVTHGYSPIEQYQTKGRMGPWTDIYALGAVMCRAITGDKPPVAADRLMEDEFAWLSHQAFPGFESTFLRNIDWALMLKPEDRPQSVDLWRDRWREPIFENECSESLEPPKKEIVPPPIPECPKTESLAIWSMALGILSVLGFAFGGFLAAVPAVLCGHFGISSIKRNKNRKGSGLAVAGLITGYSTIALGLIFLPGSFSGKTEPPGKQETTLVPGNKSPSDTIPESAGDVAQPTPAEKQPTEVIQDVSPKKSRAMNLLEARAYVNGQNQTLELVGKKFPALTQQSKLAGLAFDSSALGEGAAELDNQLKGVYGDKWTEIKEQIDLEAKKHLGNQDFTEQQGRDFVAEVRSRARGNLPEETRATLLSANPKYINNPGLELLDGWKQTFSSKGHPKSKGVDLNLSLPLSWSKREGYRPNVLQFFQNGAGFGPVFCTLMIKDLGLPEGYKLTQAEIEEFFQPEGIREFLPESANLIDSKPLSIEGAPAAMVVFDQTTQRLDVSVKIRYTQFFTVVESAMVLVQFGLAQNPKSQESLDELQAKFLPTYKTVMNTLIVNNRYSAN